MRRNQSGVIALGGMMAALAVVVMCLGGMIPVATFLCPVICMLLERFVLQNCGRRIAWAWYGAVSILSLLLGPDKEAAAVFLFLGYYPILKPWLDRRKMSLLLKLALFNGAIVLMYGLLIRLMGMNEIASEFDAMGKAMTAVTLILGNMTFWLLDRVLGKQLRRRK